MRYLMIFAVLAVCGCGQKGDLYLPQDTPSSTQAVLAIPSEPSGEELL